MERDEFEAGLRRDGYAVFSASMRPNAANPEHAHAFDARLLVIEGAMTIVRDGAPTQIYRTGETFEMPAGCRHFETAGAAGASYVVGRRAAATEAAQ